MSSDVHSFIGICLGESLTQSFEEKTEHLVIIFGYGQRMIIRWLKISAALFLTLILSVSLSKLIICVWENFQFSYGDERFEVEAWLEQNRFEQHKEAFRKRGKYIECYLALSCR